MNSRLLNESWLAYGRLLRSLGVTGLPPEVQSDPSPQADTRQDLFSDWPDACPPEKATDRQVGGGHYQGFAIQPIEFIEKNGLGFAQGCVIKYVCRYREKGGAKDLDKAIHYLQLIKEMEYPDAED